MTEKSKLLESLPRILDAVFNWDKKSQILHKGKVRNLLVKIMRKFTATEIEKYVPEEHQSLLKYLEKTERRNKSKSAKSKLEKQKEELQKMSEEIMEAKNITRKRSNRKGVEEIDLELEDLEIKNPFLNNFVEQKQVESKDLLLKFDSDVSHFVC